jgi:hypothetical protein
MARRPPARTDLEIRPFGRSQSTRVAARMQVVETVRG